MVKSNLFQEIGLYSLYFNPVSKAKCILEMCDLTQNKSCSGQRNLYYYTDQLIGLARIGELIEVLFLFLLWC